MKLLQISELPLHPIVVHFPIALFLTAALFAVISLFHKKDTIKEMTFWTLSLGILAAIAAIITGMHQRDTIVHNNTIHQMMTTHENWAYVVITLFAGLWLWRLARKNKMQKIEHYVYVLIFFIVCGMLTYQADLGGKMVFRHGAGVKPMEKIINTGHDPNLKEHKHNSHEH